jgi:hypothetical protein
LFGGGICEIGVIEMNTTSVSVPDRRSWILEVVIVRRLKPGYWEFGVGREWGRVEKGEVSLRVT